MIVWFALISRQPAFLDLEQSPMAVFPEGEPPLQQYSLYYEPSRSLSKKALVRGQTDS